MVPSRQDLNTQAYGLLKKTRPQIEKMESLLANLRAAGGFQNRILQLERKIRELNALKVLEDAGMKPGSIVHYDNHPGERCKVVRITPDGLLVYVSQDFGRHQAYQAVPSKLSLAES